MDLLPLGGWLAGYEGSWARIAAMETVNPGRKEKAWSPVNASESTVNSLFELAAIARLFRTPRQGHKIYERVK